MSKPHLITGWQVNSSLQFFTIREYPAVLENLLPAIKDRLEQVSRNRYQLLILAAPPQLEPEDSFRRLAALAGWPYLNLSLELSRALLELPTPQRCTALSRLANGLTRQPGGPVVLLDHLELLFEPSLKCDPLALLQSMSRNVTLVAAWRGQLTQGELVYAAPGHPEYRAFPAGYLNVLELSPLLTRPVPSPVQG